MALPQDPAAASPARQDYAARVEREATYWDSVVHENGRQQQRFSHVFLCPSAAWAEQCHEAAIRSAIEGKVVLDYGCGDGESSARLLALGARHVHGVDLGASAIEKARSRGLANATFQVGDAHHLPCADASFDVVVGRAILHHLDLPAATRELARVLRPHGEAFFVEPLRHNPLATLFRWLTPNARTRDEMPLSRAQVLVMERHFESSEHRYSLLVSMAVGACTSLIRGVGPFNGLLKLADRIDRVLARTPLRWWMGHIYLHLRRPRGAAGAQV